MSLFNDTQIAFADKSNSQLRKAYWMFKLIEQPALTKIGTRLLNVAVHNNFPFAGDIVKSTLFEQFCGGETREESLNVVNRMYKRGVGSIFDYSIEGKEEESTFDAVCAEIQDIVRFSVGNPALPFIVFKPTAFGRIGLYEKVSKKSVLTDAEQKEWSRIVARFDAVCGLCHENDKKVMIDAEESWMQDAVDWLIEEMMEKYNSKEAIVWNTMQMYRTGRIEYMQQNLKSAKEKGYFIGYKIVRGAYMEKERERAAEMNYPDPIQATKEASDINYNDAIDFVMANLDRVSAFFGTHNEISSELVIEKMKANGLQNNDPRIFYGQLYGMSDNITYLLANKNYNVAKYLPYGPVKDVVPYLTRRAEENTSVAGQTGRELSLISRELKRRNGKQ